MDLPRLRDPEEMFFLPGLHRTVLSTSSGVDILSGTKKQRGGLSVRDSPGLRYDRRAREREIVDSFQVRSPFATRITGVGTEIEKQTQGQRQEGTAYTQMLDDYLDDE